LAGRLSRLSDKAYGLLSDVAKTAGIDATSQDARLVALDGIQQKLVGCGFWLNLLFGMANEAGRASQEDLCRAVGSNLNWARTEMAMFDYLRHALPIMVHFKIDNLFSRILEHLDDVPERPNYSRLSTAMLGVAGLDRGGNEFKQLRALAAIRNSFHNNGIHRNKNLRVAINGIDFEFTKGERVECAGFTHVVVAIDANVDVLRKLLLSDRVGRIKESILDPFAAGE
jgi:hypothetical protein